MNILFIGDIFGECGKIAVAKELNNIKKKYSIDFTIANAENTSLCRGLTYEDYDYLVECGIDFFTMGNHTWHKKDIYKILDENNNIIRPANVVDTNEMDSHGYGTIAIKVNNKIIRITNLLGSTVSFKNLQTNPFLEMDAIINNDDSDIHIVDFHSETTSEKNAFFINYQSKVTAIIGTHTHVQTNDDRIVNDTAFITDVGMTGPYNGVIGAKSESLINMFKGNSLRFKLEEEIGEYQFCAIIISIDDKTNLPIKLKKIFIVNN